MSLNSCTQIIVGLISLLFFYHTLTVTKVLNYILSVIKKVLDLNPVEILQPPSGKNQYSIFVHTK